MTASNSWTNAGRGTRFVQNASWTLVGFGVTLASGILLSPLIIRTLGAEGYGVWTLVFALVEYVWLSDFGLRSAVLKFSAQYLAQGESDKVNEVINTGLAYFMAIASVLAVGLVTASSSLSHVFQISPTYQVDFAFLVALTGLVWSIGLVNNVMQASVQGLQKYDRLSQVSIVVTLIRVAGCLTALVLGFGLRGMGVAVLITQVISYVCTFIILNRSFKQLHLSRQFVNFAMLKQMAGYGVYTLVSTVAILLLNQGPMLLIGYLKSAIVVGLYALPVRLVATMVGAVAQVAMISVASSADLSARGDFDAVGRFGVFVNRYCLTLFLPLSIVLWVYGGEIFTLWVGPDVAAESAPLLPILLVGASLGIAAQQNSSAILYGLGRHRAFAMGLLVEGALVMLGIVYVLPRYGLVAVIWLSAGLLILDRGLWASWLVCRYLGLPYLGYMRDIYVRPLLAAVPVVAGAYLIKLQGLDGATWLEIAAAAILVALGYYGLAFFWCVQPRHRSALVHWIGAQPGAAAMRR
jgi:O-antigen/teichoic acid export membrane protein